MKSKCVFCGNYDFPVEVRKPNRKIENYCSRCGELMYIKRKPKKKEEFYKKIAEY